MPSGTATTIRPTSRLTYGGGTEIAWAYLVDQVFGDPRRGHPVAGFGTAATRLEQRCWRPTRRAGVAYVGVLVSALTVAVGTVDRALRPMPAARATWRTALLYYALGGRSLGREAHRVVDALRQDDLPAARVQLRSLVGRDTTNLTESEICRAAVESVAENTTDAVVSPLFWWAVAGPCGAAAYRAVNTLDAMVGYRNERYRQFGWASARLDDLLTWPGGRLATGLAVGLSPAVGGSPSKTFRTVRRDSGAHPSPNGGLIEAAFAGALGLRMGGVNSYGKRLEARGTLGDGRPPTRDDVVRATRFAQMIGIGAVAVLAVLPTARLSRRAGSVR